MILSPADALSKREDLVQRGYTSIPQVMPAELVEELRAWSDAIFARTHVRYEDPLPGQRPVRVHRTRLVGHGAGAAAAGGGRPAALPRPDGGADDRPAGATGGVPRDRAGEPAIGRGGHHPVQARPRTAALLAPGLHAVGQPAGGHSLADAGIPLLLPGRYHAGERLSARHPRQPPRPPPAARHPARCPWRGAAGAGGPVPSRLRRLPRSRGRPAGSRRPADRRRPPAACRVGPTGATGAAPCCWPGTTCSRSRSRRTGGPARSPPPSATPTRRRGTAPPGPPATTSPDRTPVRRACDPSWPSAVRR